MQTHQLNQTALGRIGLFYMADMRTFGRTILSIMGMILCLIFLVPRIDLLFGGTYQDWAANYVDHYLGNSHVLYVLIVANLGSFAYLNKRMFSNDPMSFSLVPASLWEKVSGMIAVIVSIHLLGGACLVVTGLLDWLTLPAMTLETLFDSYHVRVGMMDHFFEAVANHEYWEAGLGAILVMLLILISEAFAALHIRNYMLSLLVAFVIPIAVILSYIAVLQHFVLSSMEGVLIVDPEPRGAFEIGQIYLFGIIVLLSWRIYHKLRTSPN